MCVTHLDLGTNLQTINTTIVDNILNSLISNSDTIHKYRKLCYNILVEPLDEIIIFEDYTNGIALLYIWIKDLVYRIEPNNKRCCDKLEKINQDSYIYYKIYITDFKSKGIIKKEILHIKPHVVFIIHTNYNYRKTKIILTLIDELISIGIKNIILVNEYDTKSQMYNYNSYTEYLYNNKDNIIKYFVDNKTHGSYDMPNNISCKNYYQDNIFCRTRLLFNNFVKWCCTNS